MDVFLSTLGIVGAIAIVFVGTVIVLNLFFKLSAWISGTGTVVETIAIRGILKKNTLTNVVLSNGKKFERVRFVGFTNADNGKNGLPYELSGMVILEDENQQRIIVRTKTINTIIILPDVNTKTEE